MYGRKTKLVQIPWTFLSPLALNLLVGSEKVWGCKNGTDILYLPAKFGGDLPPR